jgi:hypothetical protein
MQGDKVAFIGHAGVQWAARSDIPKSQDDVAVYVGGQVPLSESLSLVGEAATKLKFNRKAASAIGLMWTGSNGMGLGIAYLNAGRSQKHEFFIGVGFPIGGSR